MIVVLVVSIPAVAVAAVVNRHLPLREKQAE